MVLVVIYNVGKTVWFSIPRCVVEFVAPYIQALRVCTSSRFRLFMVVTFESFVRERLKPIIR